MLAKFSKMCAVGLAQLCTGYVFSSESVGLGARLLLLGARPAAQASQIPNHRVTACQESSHCHFETYQPDILDTNETHTASQKSF